MTVKDLILTHEAEEVYPAYYTYYAKKEPKGSAEEQTRHKNFCEFFNKLKDREPAASDYLILVFELYCGGSELGGYVFYKEDIPEYFDENLPLKDLSIGDVDSMNAEEIKRQCEESSMPGGPMFESLPWAEVLGAEVSEADIRSLGSAQVLGAILYQLAYYRFSEEQLLEDDRRIHEAFAELDRARALGELEEVREELFRKASSLMIELKGMKISGSANKRTCTDEERAEIRRQTDCDILRTAINEYKALKAYCDEHNI